VRNAQNKTNELSTEQMVARRRPQNNIQNGRGMIRLISMPR
jgi:hypothetical protein